MTQSPAQKITALRTVMAKQNLAAYIIPRQDEFQGEYVAAYAERLKYLTGFAGSWGTAIVASKSAAIFVDGRYTTQVREQVPAKLYDYKHLMEEHPSVWLKSVLKKGDQVGFDPMLLTIADAKRYSLACSEVGASLVPTASNLIDEIWADQPKKSQKPLSLHPVEFAGQSAKEKLKIIAKSLKAAKQDCAFIAEPSSVAWALNLRGVDVPYTPVVLAYAILHATGPADLFMEPERLPPDVLKALKSIATIHPPKNLGKVLKSLKGKSVVLDYSSAPDFVRDCLEKAKAKIISGQDPCTMPKAQKNETERQGARVAQIIDGAALSNFLCWFEAQAPAETLTEGSAADKLEEIRRANPLLEDLSFNAISAAGPNAASPHYHVENGGRAIKRNEVYLIDSGGQYRAGTTDVTRTVIVGTPTPEMKDRFTRVLKGMIALTQVKFPEGTTGGHLDVLARAALWQAGLDFDHGTGHGVGSYLSVHEGPARISKAGNVALKPGMILSNEPGYYKPGHYGIRIENLLLVSEAQDISGGERKMLHFETLTFAPIDRNLIDTSLLSASDIQWLNAYHSEVLAKLSPHVSVQTKQWLEKTCSPLKS